MKYCICIVLSFIFSVEISNAQQLKFRTDGYYFYDNMMDTIIVAPISAEGLALLNTMLHVEYDVDTSMSITCLPKGKVPLEGSTNIHVIAFFNELTGTAFHQACRDAFTYQHSMQAILLRRQGKDFRKKIAASQSICNVHIRQDNTFTFETSTTPYFKEYYYGTIYPDSLVLYATRGAKPRGMKNYEKIRTYHFFRFGEIPPSAYRKQYISYDIKYQ